jgi:hypothetical protein
MDGAVQRKAVLIFPEIELWSLPHSHTSFPFPRTPLMNLDHLDRFTVYWRRDARHVCTPEDMEKPLGSFFTYEAALRQQRRYQRQAKHCVIRFEGDTGGGD